MRLLFVIPEFPPHSGGGIVTFYRTLLPELVKLGHEVRALVGSAFTSKLDAYRLEGVEVEFLDHELVAANLPRFEGFRALPELQQHLSAAWTAYEQANAGNEYDLVETVDWGMLFVPWVVAESNPPVVVQLHGSAGQIDHRDPKQGAELLGHVTRLLEMNILEAAEELQTYSDLNAREWEAITGREVSYIPPAWAPVEMPRWDGGSSEAGLAVGRIQYWKGPIVLCEALRLLGVSAPEINWIGRDTPYRHSSTSMSEHLLHTYPDVWGLKVRAMGPHSPAETLAAQARAAFSVVPSVWDVFNFTCAEGMGAGRTVICSTGAGASGLIVNGKNGFVFPPNDAAALASVLQRVVAMTSSERQSIGGAARETILDALAPGRVAAERSQRYEALAARGRSRQPVRPWVADAVRPGEPVGRPLAFLDSLPLRDLSEYAMRRSLRRVFH
jgi:glycosyltransferase involved in cell wall biosynthesis